MDLAANLIRHCKKLGWSLNKLAKEAGVPKSTLHEWTIERKTLDLTQLKKVSDTLKVSIHELVYGVPDPYEIAPEHYLNEIFSGDVRVTIHRIDKVNSRRKA